MVDTRNFYGLWYSDANRSRHQVSQSFHGQSTVQLQKHIRWVAKDTSRVFITRHARDRMRERTVLQDEVYECLRQGLIRLTPEPDLKTGNLVCRMERYVCGRSIGICVALADDDPDLIVVTVLEL